MKRQFDRLFPTPIWMVHNPEFDNCNLLEKIQDHSRKTPSQYLSNRGGYQGHEFVDDDLFSFIGENIPTHPNKQITEYSIAAWVNINKPGCYNVRHSHLHTDTLLSGVYYVKVPEDSGVIKFWDPRGHWMHTMRDNDYYNDCLYSYDISPEPGLLLLFPCWLEHEVSENLSNDERISVSFNIQLHSHEIDASSYLQIE